MAESRQVRQGNNKKRHFRAALLIVPFLFAASPAVCRPACAGPARVQMGSHVGDCRQDLTPTVADPKAVKQSKSAAKRSSLTFHCNARD